MYACIYAPDFAVQAAVRLRPEMRDLAIAILVGDPPLEAIFALNRAARAKGAAVGMSRLQAESFPQMRLHRRSLAEETSAHTVLLELAGTLTPRVEAVDWQNKQEPCGTFVLDISGTRSLFGSPAQIAETARRKAADHGLEIQIAIAANFHAAVCAARGFRGITLFDAGKESERLASLPLEVLDLSPESDETFRLWGIHTCGELAALPERDLIARIGQEGQRLRSLARGELPHLLVPVEAGFGSQLIETIELEYPVEELEPLLFLFGRMIDALLLRIRERALAIAEVQVALTLDRGPDGVRPIHRRTIRPALPSQDARTLLKLIQLDLEMHPPQAAVVVVQVSAGIARPHRVQHGLFLPQAPEPGRLEVLLARLRKLLGEKRVGSPQLADAHRPEAFLMATFTPPEPRPHSLRPAAKAVLRVCRPPMTIHVTVHAQKPSTVTANGSRFTVINHAGPWRSSGEWWSETCWCREEWDVELADNSSTMISRIAYDPASNCWYMQGIYD